MEVSYGMGIFICQLALKWKDYESCTAENIWPTKAKSVSLSEVAACDGELCFATPPTVREVQQRMGDRLIAWTDKQS